MPMLLRGALARRQRRFALAGPPSQPPPSELGASFTDGTKFSDGTDYLDLTGASVGPYVETDYVLSDYVEELEDSNGGVTITYGGVPVAYGGVPVEY